VQNDEFSEDIKSKPYPKYKYQSVSAGLKMQEKKAFLEAINRRFIEHLYVLHPLKKSGQCLFCPKKSTKKASLEQRLVQGSLQTIHQLDLNDLVEISKRKEPKRTRFRGKRTK
jgi:hypothetical protein